MPSLDHAGIESVINKKSHLGMMNCAALHQTIYVSHFLTTNQATIHTLSIAQRLFTIFLALHIVCRRLKFELLLCFGETLPSLVDRRALCRFQPCMMLLVAPPNEITAILTHQYRQSKSRVSLTLTNRSQQFHSPRKLSKHKAGDFWLSTINLTSR
jgi:hypothetical protein